MIFSIRYVVMYSELKLISGILGYYIVMDVRKLIKLIFES